MVQTGYLSLTRGESKPNYTAWNPGVARCIRVEEMLAARRFDGGEQYFTRAYTSGAYGTRAAFQAMDRKTLLATSWRFPLIQAHLIVAPASAGSADHDGQRQLR